MKYFKHFVLLAVLALPAAYLQGQVTFGIQIGPDYGFYNPPPGMRVWVLSILPVCLRTVWLLGPFMVCGRCVRRRRTLA